MAKVTMFVLCDHIENIPAQQGQITHLVAPQVALRPAYIPGSFSFGLAVGVQGINLSQVNKIKFKILTPNSDVIQESTEEAIPVIGQEDSLPVEFHGFVLNLDIRNLVVKDEGIYKFILFVNGDPLEAQNIPIYRGC